MSSRSLVKIQRCALQAFHTDIFTVDESETLKDIPNVFPFQRVIHTDRAIYLIRQWFLSSLYDRISTRPFLELVEKKWIAYQLLKGIEACHRRGVIHGDIKTENVMITSWTWAYLADLSSAYKCVSLPDDNPAYFSFFFDSSGRRTCYIAPERFFTPGKDGDRSRSLTEAMDVFSLGCVFVELFLEGPIPFDLSQLLGFRSGEYDPTVMINTIVDDGVRRLILRMVQLDPAKRPAITECLTLSYVFSFLVPVPGADDMTSDGTFPSYFEQLHTLVHTATHPFAQDMADVQENLRCLTRDLPEMIRTSTIPPQGSVVLLDLLTGYYLPKVQTLGSAQSCLYQLMILCCKHALPLGPLEHARLVLNRSIPYILKYALQSSFATSEAPGQLCVIGIEAIDTLVSPANTSSCLL